MELYTTIYSLPRSVLGGGTCRELRRSVGRSVVSANHPWRRPMLGCTDLVHPWLRGLPGVSWRHPKVVWMVPHIGRCGWRSPNAPLTCLPSILSRFGDPRSSFAWVQRLVTFGVCFLWLVGPWIHGRGHMDTIFTLDDEPSLNQHLGCLQSVFLASGMDW